MIYKTYFRGSLIYLITRRYPLQCSDTPYLIICGPVIRLLGAFGVFQVQMPFALIKFTRTGEHKFDLLLRVIILYIKKRDIHVWRY